MLIHRPLPRPCAHQPLMHPQRKRLWHGRWDSTRCPHLGRSLKRRRSSDQLSGTLHLFTTVNKTRASALQLWLHLRLQALYSRSQAVTLVGSRVAAGMGPTGSIPQGGGHAGPDAGCGPSPAPGSGVAAAASVAVSQGSRGRRRCSSASTGWLCKRSKTTSYNSNSQNASIPVHEEFIIPRCGHASS